MKKDLCPSDYRLDFTIVRYEVIFYSIYIIIDFKRYFALQYPFNWFSILI